MNVGSSYVPHKSMIAAFAALILMAVGTPPSLAAEMKMMGDMMAADAPALPPVTGYSEGEEILFLHTETSDPRIAQILTDMMGSPVLLVSSLADVPDKLLARVYVFGNGVEPDGPRGPLMFQPDVFDAPPGHSDYTPLRAVVVVRWRDSASPRVLKSAVEVERAFVDGEVTFEETGVVVNMPFITWPGGQR